jgi:hypothetical protein
MSHFCKVCNCCTAVHLSTVVLCFSSAKRHLAAELLNGAVGNK